MRKLLPAMTAVVGLAIGLGAEAFAATTGPSFKCKYARLPAERAICQSTRLSRLDRVMADTYFELRRQTSRKRDRTRLSQEQSSWLLRRNECGARRRCLSRRYEARIATLDERLQELKGGGGFVETGPSFNCRHAKTATERAICRSGGLARLDREMAGQYKLLKDRLRRGSARRGLEKAQARWRGDRDRCGRRRRCLRLSYENRITELGQAIEDLDYGALPEVKPSFDCRDARLAAEKEICSRPRLAKLDVKMAGLYRAISDQLGRGQERRTLKWDQGQWLRQRNQCEGSGRCIREAYADRIYALESLQADLGQNVEPAGAHPSFDCGQASQPTEQVICESEVLANLDQQLAGSYDQQRQTLRGRKRRKLEREQAAWLEQRNECRYRFNCIREAYEERLFSLSNSVEDF